MPNIGLVYALSAGANSIFTLVQSASSSSARSIGRAVVTPWPISERSTTMSTLLSGLIGSHALGAKGAAAAAANRPPAGRWNPITRPAPAAAVVSRNSRRETCEGARVAQHPVERRVGRDVDRFTLAVDGEGNRGHDGFSSTRGLVNNVHRRPARGKGGHAFRTKPPEACSRGRIVTEPSHPRITYARRLGLFSATMAVIGGIIGSGVFLGPQIVAAHVGRAGLGPVPWVVGGVIALAGAFCFGELGARRPRAGGGYVYLREAFGPLPAFFMDGRCCS